MAWSEDHARCLADYLEGLALVARASIDIAKTGDVKLANTLLDTIECEVGKRHATAAKGR